MAKNTVEVSIVGDADSAVKAFRQVDDAGAETQSKFKGVSSGFSSDAKAAFAGVGVASVAAVGASLFKLGADLQQVDSKAKIVFGDQITVVEAWAKKSANAMGLTASQAKGLATNMADLLIPMEFTREQATAMSTEVVGLSGALSAWSGGTKSATEVSEILTSAMLGERDALKSLGISISAAEVEAELLRLGQDKLTGSARAQAEATATMTLIMAKSKDAQTAFKDSTISTNEQMAIQSAKFKELQEKVGTFVHKGLNEYAAWAMDPSGGKAVTGFWADYNRGIDRVTMATQGLINRTAGLRSFMEAANALNPAFRAAQWIGDRLPKFHDGGVVPGRRGTEVPIMAQAGETVVPIGGPSGGGNVLNVTFASPMVSREAADYFVGLLEDHLGRGGDIGNGRGASVVLA